VKDKNNPYIDSRVEIRWIPEINGRGIFAREFIPAQTIIEKAPLVIFPKKLMEMAIWMLQADGMRSHEFKLDQYTVDWSDQGAVPLGWAAIYNHSDTNNCEFHGFYEDELLGIIALRDIKAGEQCCVTYGSSWFAEKGYVKKVDF